MPTHTEIHDFSLMIRKRASENKISLWEALSDYSEETGMENGVVASLLTRSLRSEIQDEVTELNLLKRKGRRNLTLPI